MQLTELRFSLRKSLAKSDAEPPSLSMRIAYARVSTDGQTLDAQVSAFGVFHEARRLDPRPAQRDRRETAVRSLADFERELIRDRTHEGQQREEALIAALERGTTTAANLARRFNLVQSTISRLRRHAEVSERLAGKPM